MKPTNRFPARIFILIPEENHRAIVIRRGPAEKTGIYSWNIKTDQVRVAQWLKGRVYEYFSDVSPDGDHFLYSANKKGFGYTVVSRAPWLKAITLTRNVGGLGGGIFASNNSYMLGDGNDCYNEFASPKFTSIKRDFEMHKYGVYCARLRKRGWVVKSINSARITLLKRIDQHTSLEKLINHNSRRKGKGSWWEFHRLIYKGVVYEKPDWEWCEWLNNQLVWTEGGILYRGRISVATRSLTGKLIYNFNLDSFIEVTAPY